MSRRVWVPEHDGRKGEYIEISDERARNEDNGGELCPDGVWRAYKYDKITGRPERTGRWKNGVWVPYTDRDPMFD